VAAIGMVGSAATCVALAAFLPDIQSHSSGQEGKDSAATASAEFSATATTAASPSSSPPPSASSSKGWSSALQLLSDPSIRGLVLLKLFAVLSLALYRSSFSLLARDHFGLTPQQNGFILSGVGGASMLVNIFCVGWLSARYEDQTIVRSCLAVVAASLLASAWMALGRLELLLLYLAPMTLSGAVVAIILTATLTKSSAKEDAGAVLGLDMGVGTAARVMAPTLGGWMLQIGYEAVGTGAALMAIVAWALAARGGVFANKAASQQPRDVDMSDMPQVKKEL